MSVRDEFAGFLLNDQGTAKCRAIGEAFTECLTKIEAVMPKGRELALVITKLQEASAWAKRGVAQLPENRDPSMEKR